MRNVILFSLSWLFVLTGYGATSEEDWVSQREFIASVRRQVKSLRAENRYLVRLVRQLTNSPMAPRGKQRGRIALGLIVAGSDLIKIDQALFGLLEENVLESSFVAGLPRPDLVLELITWVQDVHLETRLFVLDLFAEYLEAV